MKCPACQTVLKDDAKFCFKCGQRIPRCPTCGEPVLTRSKFCGKDGTPLPQEVLDLLPTAPGPVEHPGVQPAPRPAAQKIEAWSGFETVTEAGSNQIPPRKSYCAKCGRVIAQGQQLCDSCRAKAQQSRTVHHERQAEKKKKEINLLLVLVVVTILVCLVTAAVCIAAFSGKSKAEENETVAPPNSGWFEYYDEELGINVLGTEPEEMEIVETQAPMQPSTEALTEPPTEAPTEPEIDADPRLLYFIENCDSMYLTEDDVEGFDKEMCRIARNSLYAKSGRTFKDSELQEFFEQFDWYDPWISPSDFTGDMFNKYQSANLNMISKYEREHGFR